MIAHSKPWLLKDDQLAVEGVLHSGMIADGCIVSAFEQAVCRYLGMAGGVAASSGTIALLLALKALDVEGGEVICPSYVCRAVWDAIRWAGGRPVFYDLGLDWSPAEESIRARLTRQTKAIIIVHNFGIVTDLSYISTFDIPVIEDCCQAIGGRFNNRLAGTLGQYCILSFHATKLFTTGKGGMVLTNTQSYFERVTNLTRDGYLENQFHYPMTDLQAVLGLSQLKKYDDFLKRRRAIAEYYYDAFSEWSEFLPLSIRQKSVFFRFPLQIQQMDFEAARVWFEERGIQVRRGVDALLHRELRIADEKYPESTSTFNKTLSIPLYPALQDWEVDEITKRTKEFFQKHAS